MEYVPFIGILSNAWCFVFRHFVVQHKVVSLAIMCGQSGKVLEGGKGGC